MDIPSESDATGVANLAVIRRLAEEFLVPVEDVLSLYEQRLTLLRDDARVTTFLSVLTTKHVRAVLQEEKRRLDH